MITKNSATFLVGVTFLSVMVSVSRGAHAAPPIKSRFTLDGSQEEVIRSSVRVMLRDPWSAIFGPVYSGLDATGAVQFCGSVNAKNGYGGYTGFDYFTGTIDVKSGVASVFGFSEDRYKTKEILESCDQMRP